MCPLKYNTMFKILTFFIMSILTYTGNYDRIHKRGEVWNDFYRSVKIPTNPLKI